MNKSGDLHYYVDLNIQTETNRSLLQFFLTDIVENKAILRYSWLAATQPKIDWKQGWIDSTHLPIILRTTDAKKAKFMPRTVNQPKLVYKDQYFIGKVTIGATETLVKPTIPQEYQ